MLRCVICVWLPICVICMQLIAACLLPFQNVSAVLRRRREFSPALTLSALLPADGYSTPLSQLHTHTDRQRDTHAQTVN